MFENFKNWWEGATEKEQKLTLISGIVVLFAIIYFMLWMPLADNLAQNQQKLKKAEQTLQWVETNANKLVKAGISKSPKSSKKKNLSQLINSTAKRSQINISRIQNHEGKVDVWINQVEFDQFIAWITTLENKYRVQVKSADLSRHKIQGTVKINRLSLSY